MGRRQPQRAAAIVPTFRQALGEDQRSRRIAKRLDDLERTNYTGAGSTSDSYKPSLFGLGAPDEDEADAAEVKLNQEQLDALTGDQIPAKRKRKLQSQSLRVLLTYRYTVEELIDQSGLAKQSKSIPSYLTATAPASKTPPLKLCTVCGYWGRHACTRCGYRYCGVNCMTIHSTERCERR